MTDERLVFGVTIDQVDELNTLLRTITANGDAMTFCDTSCLQPQSVSTMGEAILDSALALREIFDQVNEQRIERAPAPEVGP
jgi:hypothetical protein